MGREGEEKTWECRCVERTMMEGDEQEERGERGEMDGGERIKKRSDKRIKVIFFLTFNSNSKLM